MLNNRVLIDNIRRLCSEHNIRITNLEKELGFGAGIISRWGNDADPSLSKVIQIAEYFHVSLDEIVGFDINTIFKNEFLLLLYENTQNGNIKWHSLSERSNDDVQTYDMVGYNNYSRYSPDEESDYTFYMKYQEGYIVLYSVCHIDNVTDPVELYLAIQPQKDSTTCKLVDQKCNKEELLPLYLKILTSLQDEAPDEIKAEALKASFINEFRKMNSDIVINIATDTESTNEKSILETLRRTHSLRQEDYPIILNNIKETGR